MMKTRLNGTERPKKDAGGLRHGLLVLAVLLLTCVLMAGAVSATEVPVSSYDELAASLLDDGVTKITLNNDIDAEEIITINHDVTIDGSYHTIGVNDSKKNVWPQTGSNKDLIQITGDVSVVLENITLDSEDTAFGLQAYNNNPVTKLVTLENVVLTNSFGSGLNVNGGNVSLINVTIQNSGWQSVDVSANAEGASSSFMMDSQSKLRDEVEINTDQPTKDVTLTLPSEYSKYSFSYGDEGYGEKKLVWSTDVNAAAGKIAESKGVTFNATVQNPGDSLALAYYADFSEAMDAAEDGATVTQLQDITLTEPITIDEAITFDGSKKKIIGSSSTGYFLMVAVPLTGNEDNSVTLQNLNLDISSIGGSANLGGITVRANADNDASVPVILKNSIVDMSDVDMTGTTSMNPAVYFVNASGSQIINNNKITAGAASSSSTRCVVVDGGSGVIVSGNKLTLGSVSGTAVAVGVEIKGNDVDKVTVSGNTLATGSGSGEEPRAVKITAKDTGSQKTFTVSKNTIQFGGKGTTVEVLLSTYEITDPANARVNLDVEENTGNTASVVMLNKGNADDDTVLTSTIALTGNIYNPALTSSEEVAVVGGFIEEGSTQPNTDDVTHVNPAPQPVYSSGGNMNNAYRVLFNDGSTTLSVQTDLSSGDKLTKPETPVKDGYTFAGWYKDSACTQGWDFETGISGDMTLYAKWTAAGSSGETEATATPTKTQTAVTTPQPTKTQTAAATTSAPEATTAAGVSPTLTQAPAPVAGALFGLLAAGVLLRRRFQ